MFDVEARDELRNRVLEMARADQRVVAAAEVGSLAAGEGDRWSDVDLTFAVDDATYVNDVLADWTTALIGAGAAQLFDLTAGPTLYRVFMFPGCLQLDVSFTPAAQFRPSSPRFRLVFGEAAEMRPPNPPSDDELLGWAVMWATHARRCIERERWWQAEHCITSMRQQALGFACLRRDLPASHGRGVDRLPSEVREHFESSLVTAYEVGALRDALKNGVAALAAECAADTDVDPSVRDRLVEAVAGL